MDEIKKAYAYYESLTSGEPPVDSAEFKIWLNNAREALNKVDELVSKEYAKQGKVRPDYGVSKLLEAAGNV